MQWKEILNFVPESIKEMVRKDNTEFVVDRQVFHNQFFHLINLVLKHIANNLLLSTSAFPSDFEYRKYVTKMKQLAL